MTNIVVPELGESVVEARVVKWLKNAGDRVAAGDALVELETEKIDLEVSADRPGVLASIKHEAGADVKVGEVLAVLDDQQDSTADGSKGAKGAVSAKGAEEAAAQTSNDKKVTPTAKNVAREQRIDIEAVSGSGARGRVTKNDILRAAAPAPSAQAPAPSAAAAARQAPDASSSEAGGAAAARPAPPATPALPARSSSERSETRERMSKRRATIARRLVEAQHTAAMLTTFNEVDMSAVMSLRERRKEAFQKTHGVGIGIASFFVKAAVGALKAFPQINAEIQGDEIVFKHYYDIGMAVGAEGGLVVPVLRDADRMSFVQVEQTIREFAKKAGDGTLTLEDLKGGTFTITNGGVFGSLMSTPILNPPQVGILGLHKIADRAVAIGGQVVIRPMMYVALSYDHRLVDGREAVQFLVKIKDFIEDPGLMLLEG
jgi:2-oxoglutarate dehydrogenase E2 component (dihydrolipoamide succinyltransferase)